MLIITNYSNLCKFKNSYLLTIPMTIPSTVHIINMTLFVISRYRLLYLEKTIRSTNPIQNGLFGSAHDCFFETAPKSPPSIESLTHILQ